MGKHTLNHYRIVTPDRRNQTGTPEPKWYEAQMNWLGQQFTERILQPSVQRWALNRQNYPRYETW